MNVILVISDTMRRDHVGAYGEGKARTPNLDRLAAESVRFERAFVSSFPTVPCRNDILTGRYTFAYKPWEPASSDDALLQEVLARHGVLTYLTADTPHPFAPAYNYQRGFHGWELIRGQEHDRWRTSPRHIELPAAPNKLRSPEDTVPQYLRNVARRQREEEWFPARTARAAVSWLEESVGDGIGIADKPFFLYVDTFDPHEPWDPPAHYLALYEKEYTGESAIYPSYDRSSYLTPAELRHCRALFAGEVSLVDHWVGYLLDAVDRLGLRDDTAIIFMADHGFYLGEHGYIGKSLITPAYQQPLPLYPEVSRIPLLIRAPHLHAGLSDVLAQPVDIFPTVLELCGVPAENVPAAVQGRSLGPALRGEVGGSGLRGVAVASPTLSHPHLRVPHPTTRATVTDGAWLLVYGSQVHDVTDPETTAMVDSVLRSVRTLEQGRILPEVYDLANDPGCERNLWGSANPSARTAAQNLHGAFVERLESLGVPERHLQFFRRLPG